MTKHICIFITTVVFACGLLLNTALATAMVQTDSNDFTQIMTKESNLVPLSNKSLASIIKNTEYNGWLLYQPEARESEINTSTDNYLNRVSAYPVVAIQDDKICLIILKKQSSKWYVAITNETALVQDGFELVSFSLDESYSHIDDTQNVYFEFESNETIVNLALKLSSIYPSYFSSMHYLNTTLVMHYERGISYEVNYPFLFSCSYEINPEPYIEFSVSDFSLQRFFQTIQELLVHATVGTEKNGADLFVMPDDATKPIMTLEKGESVCMIKQEKRTEWEMVYYNGHILFVHGEDIEYKKEW